MGFRCPNFAPLRNSYNYLSRISPTNRRISLISSLLPTDSHHDSFFYSNPNHSKSTIRWHVGHSHHGDEKGADYVFRLGLAADIALSAGKALTGYLTGSTAIIADAAHSVSDVVLSGVALWSFRVARAPKDKEHPYGHGKFESLGALGISCMLVVTAGGIAWHAVEVLQGLLSSTPAIFNHSLAHEHASNHGHGGHHHGIDMNHPILALNMTIISIFTKEGLYWITKRVGERVGSGLMQANAWHHRADAVSSVVTLIGVGGSILGVHFLDPLAGLVVSGMILKAGVQTGYQSVMELVDAAVPLPLLDPIRKTILEVEGVKGCHRLRGRKAGSFLYLDVHIEVDPFLSVSAAHDIGENVRYQIHKVHPEVVEVFIHIDPAISECPHIILDQRKNLNGMEHQHLDIFSKHQDAETIASDILSSKFSEKMVVEHVTRHSLQGKILLQVQVSMPGDMLIRDATELAKEAEKEILKAASASNIIGVSIQLRLGHPIPRFHYELAEDNK